MQFRAWEQTLIPPTHPRVGEPRHGPGARTFSISVLPLVGGVLGCACCCITDLKSKKEPRHGAPRAPPARPRVRGPQGILAAAAVSRDSREPAMLLLSNGVQALQNGMGLTPAMGWSSWNTFRCEINEKLIHQVARAVVHTGLRDAGYQYINLDDCWQKSRGADGHIIPDPEKFPSGMKALGNFLHGLGLRFGIYSDTSNVTCENRPGSMGYERVDAADYASWGVDYLKYDYCGMESAPLPARHYYERMRDALNATGRPIHYSICSWGVGEPHSWGASVGNSWRTGRDLFAVWDEATARDVLQLPALLQSVEAAIAAQARLGHWAGPGGFNDPDMLVVGIDGMSAYGPVTKCPAHLSPAACTAPGQKPGGKTNTNPLEGNEGEYVPRAIWGKVGGLTTTEQRSVFSFWCMLAAPLILGNDPRWMKRSTARILKAAELIAINQDRLGFQARLAWRGYDGCLGGCSHNSSGPLQIWRKKLHEDRVAVLMFNAGSSVSDITCVWNRDLSEIAKRWQRPFPRDPPCHDTRSDCREWASQGGGGKCWFDLQNKSHAEMKASCMRTCGSCPKAKVHKGKYAVALVRNAWEEEYEGVFGAQFTARHVEPHEARVYVLKFEEPKAPRHSLYALMAQKMRKEQSELYVEAASQQQDHLQREEAEENDRPRRRAERLARKRTPTGVKLASSSRVRQALRADREAINALAEHQRNATKAARIAKRMERLAKEVSALGAKATPTATCFDAWAVSYPAEVNERDKRSCRWKLKWNQCDKFGEYCKLTCGKCTGGPPVDGEG